MLPPIDPTILSTHSKFDALYHDLCANKLNPDGSTAVDEKTRKERDGFQKDIHAARINATKREVIKVELSGIACRAESLPDELRDLVAVVAALLDGQIPSEDKEIVQEYVDQFVDNPFRITRTIQRQLRQTTSTLSCTISPDTDPSDLPFHIRALKSSLATSNSSISSTRLNLTHEATSLHALYSQVLATSIRLLEQTVHGSVSRASKAQAEYLALVAEGMSKKLGLQHAQLLAQVYSPEVQEWLRVRYERFAREDRAVRRKAEEAEDVLGRYRAGRGMEGVAREYAEIVRETERVRGEIERLEAKGGSGGGS